MKFKEGNVIIIKYGELWLKSENVKRLFINRLSFFLRQKIKEYGITAEFVWKRDHGIMIYKKEYEDLILHLLSLTPGITHYHIAYMFELEDLDKIWENVNNLLGEKINKADTFAVRCKRAGKHNFSSKDIEKYIGSKVVEKYNKKVNLENPDIIIKLEIRQDKVYIILHTHEGVRGLPPCSGGEIVAYIDNSKESLVMLYDLFKRGIKLAIGYNINLNENINDLITFISPSILNKKSVEDIVKDHKVVALPNTDLNEIEQIHNKYYTPPTYPLLLFPLVAQSKEEIEAKYEKIIKALTYIREQREHFQNIENENRT